MVVVEIFCSCFYIKGDKTNYNNNNDHLKNNRIIMQWLCN